tara:strand:+ start:439 stop:735 length:297 start_codon:yes stop_codon:yes gene_type:complete
MTTNYVQNIENKFSFTDTLTNSDIHNLTNQTIEELNYTYFTEARIDIVIEIVIQIIDKYYFFESKEERDIINSLIIKTINTHIEPNDDITNSCVCCIS